MLTLEPISRQNLRTVVALETRPDQRSFVATNVFSIAQASLYETWTPMAIRVGEELVGFVMWGQDEDPPADAAPSPAFATEWWIIRLMIDHRVQRRGHGRLAMQRILQVLGDIPDITAVLLAVEPTNAPARRLYESLGFVFTGRVEDGEQVFVLEL